MNFQCNENEEPKMAEKVFRLSDENHKCHWNSFGITNQKQDGLFFACPTHKNV